MILPKSAPCLVAVFCAFGAAAQTVNVDSFRDGAKHYRDGSGRDTYARYDENDVAAIADIILLHQRANGGWPSNWDPQRILSEDERAAVLADREKLDTTFDNRATYPQIDYLAEAFTQTGDARYRVAAERGIEFMLEAQHPCGGFPHSYPSTANYRPYVTFMDDVTSGALTTLRAAAEGAPRFTFLRDALRARMAEASARGTAGILALQQRWQGGLAVWAGQYDPKTFEPVMARKFEQPGLVCAESVRVTRYLMEISNPSPEVIRAIEGAVAWFEASKIEGLRVETFSIDPVRFDNHTATRDVCAISDPSAPPIWGRFYEFGTNRPFMANRDGIKVYTLAEVQLERRTGYNWYGVYPAHLLATEYPKWREGLTAATPD